jgi:hypothetical protein
VIGKAWPPVRPTLIARASNPNREHPTPWNAGNANSYCIAM